MAKRKVSNKGSIKLLGSDITIDGMSVELYVSKNKQALLKASKGNTVARNLVLRYFSDFISTEGPFKEPRKQLFSNPAAAPDIAGSVDDFKKYFGFVPTSTGVNGADGAFAELKQKTANRSITITSKVLADNDLRSFIDTMGLKNTTNAQGNASFDKSVMVNELSNETLVNFIKSNKTLRASVERQIVQKFENFVVIDYLDKDTKNAPMVRAMGGAAKALFGSDVISSKNLSVVARRTTNSTSTKAGITLQYELSEQGYQKFVEKATDITIKFHKYMGNNISNRFIKEAMTRFAKGKAKQNTYNFIAATVGIASEFEKRPVKYVTVIKKPKQGSIETRVTATKETTKHSVIDKQQFISGAQMTALVQKRLAKTMGGGGIATPPWFTERSGRFRSSISVYPNYRNNLIRFTYMPLYDANIKYGYDPEGQVGKSIREVVTALYTRKFNIVRV